MRIQVLLLVLAILGSCKEEDRSHSARGDNQGIARGDTIFWTDDSLYTTQRSSMFGMDTLSVCDSSRNLTITLRYPETGNQAVDDKILAGLNRQKNSFTAELDYMLSRDSLIAQSWRSGFDAELVSYYQDDRIISALFRMVYYHPGAAHPMTQYQTFNFDGKSLKSILFDEYFSIESAKDTGQMAQLIRKKTNRSGICLSPLSQMDFNIERDTISFNFDTYETGSYAEGALRVKVERKLLDEFQRIRFN
jgi:hypothetical protein